MHEPRLRKLSRSVNVNGAPDAPRLTRSEANLVAHRINALANAVDPAEAECAIDSFRPGDAGEARVALIESNPEFLCIRVMLFEPRAPFGWRGKERWQCVFEFLGRH